MSLHSFLGHSKLESCWMDFDEILYKCLQNFKVILNFININIEIYFETECY
jgi:hypothetical protein